MNEPYDIIDTVRLTEKATLLAEKENKYVFRVRPHATKTQIKDAIQRLFKKTVIAVNTANVIGKKKRQRSRPGFGHQADWKKAIVTLKAGDKIELA
jgi:large subunit ribosomal protein L23